MRCKWPAACATLGLTCLTAVSLRGQSRDPGLLSVTVLRQAPPPAQAQGQPGALGPGPRQVSPPAPADARPGALDLAPRQASAAAPAPEGARSSAQRQASPPAAASAPAEAKQDVVAVLPPQAEAPPLAAASALAEVKQDVVAGVPPQAEALPTAPAHAATRAWRDKDSVVPDVCPVCPEVPKSLIILDGQITAGLGDRHFLFQRIGGIARLLCANFTARSPREQLGPYFNDGHLVSASVGWDRYFDTQSFPGPRLYNKSDWKVRFNQTPHDTIEDNRSDHTISSRMSDFSRGLAAALEGRSFTWHIRSWLLSDTWTKLARKVWPGVEKCVGEVQLRRSPFVGEIAGQVIAQLGLKRGGFSTLHIRRLKDVRARCNSDVPVTLRYMSCAAQSETAPVLLFTDELDEGYLKPLLAGLTALGLTVHHGDPVATRIVNELGTGPDNFLVYFVSKEIQAWASRQFFRSWHNCPPVPREPCH
ncbi:unnamed protein product [Prorocentrum cordatum]|uniref:Uncharacterized protein n=1 Tax=Prorocentrum cordatum TaxID=2364126 RepID=A0ABN9PDS7_9DINO|nr:unnamed protein product [Polarella glacialis]